MITRPMWCTLCPRGDYTLCLGYCLSSVWDDPVCQTGEAHLSWRGCRTPVRWRCQVLFQAGGLGRERLGPVFKIDLMEAIPETVPTVKTKWYQAGLRFGCTQCGNCCSGPPGYVWVNREEIRAIQTETDRSWRELRRRAEILAET